jgi:hypothetical protein
LGCGVLMSNINVGNTFGRFGGYMNSPVGQTAPVKHDSDGALRRDALQMANPGHPSNFQSSSQTNYSGHKSVNNSSAQVSGNQSPSSTFGPNQAQNLNSTQKTHNLAQAPAGQRSWVA